MRTVGYSILSVVSFALTAFGLHALLPMPDIEGVSRKIHFLAEHVSEYDTLFIGSSRVRHGVNPAVFDAMMAAAGAPTHSYNFGIDGMLPPESFFVIDQLLAMHPRRLRWVFVELEDVQISVAPGDVGTRRAVYWHDWTRSAIVVRKILELDIAEKAKQKRRRIFRNRADLGTDLFLFVENVANFGRGFDLMGLMPREEDLPLSSYEPQGDGYAPSDKQMNPEEAAQYEKWLADDLATSHPHAVDAYAESAFRQCARSFRALGATPIFFVMPGSSTYEPSGFRNASGETVMAFNNASRYPSLYRREGRLDIGHLNSAGADEFTRLLATRLLDWKAQ
jgi:hypothetical protein